MWTGAVIFTVAELARIPPQSNLWKLQPLVAQLTNLVISLTADLGICKRHNLVEIAEACRREAKYLQAWSILYASSEPIRESHCQLMWEVSFYPI